MAGWLAAGAAVIVLLLFAARLWRSERRAWRMFDMAGELLDLGDSHRYLAPDGPQPIPLPGRPNSAEQGEAAKRDFALGLMDAECLGFVGFQLRESPETGSRVEMTYCLPEESRAVVADAILEFIPGVVDGPG